MTLKIEENINITVFANITNIGRVPALNFIAQIFDGDPDANGIQIGSNFTLNLGIGEYRVINLSWGFESERQMFSCRLTGTAG